MRNGKIVAAVIAAVVLEVLITAFTWLYAGDVGDFGSGLYGAPVPVGTSCGFCGVISLGDSNTFSLAAFSANVALTALMLWLLMRFVGHPALVAGGGLVLFATAVLMYLLLSAGSPVAGIPIPVATRQPLVAYPRVQPQALWADCLVGAAVAGWLPSLRRARDSASQGDSWKLWFTTRR